jgi:sugar (pentulose or hexulose) kinase/phosphoglycerate dehydrogenase-like enzyme/ribulose-5-phosphate 4-epimerase/fuculose-1-phosphate aldolase/putative sterol carrier protein
LSKSQYLMALDAGGGGGRCLLVDVAGGRTIRTFRAWTHPTAPGTSGLGTDLDLHTIWESLASSAREAVERAAASAEDVLGVAVTSTRHTTVLLDREGKPILAAPNRDGRAFAEAFQLAAEHGDTLYARTGRWPIPLASASRLAWLAANQPKLWKRAGTVLSLNDWVAYRLTGELVTDPSQAEETLLLDVETRAWAHDLAELLAVPERLLPPLREAGSRLGGLTAEAATALGLNTGTPVAVGGGDTQCGLLGAGSVAPGQAAVIAGTTVPLQLVLDRPVIDPQQRMWTGCHVVPGLWVLESNAGPMGDALEWLAEILYPEAPNPAARFLAEADRSNPGAAGLLSTFGSSVMNARELKLPIGMLTFSHMTAVNGGGRRRHLNRAVVDGMAYAIRANLEQIRDLAGHEIGSLALAGGISRSAAFAQAVADALGVPVEVGATGEATALGAAIAAGVGAGVFPDLAAGARALRGKPALFEPRAAESAAYRERYQQWRRLVVAEAAANDVAAELILPSVLAERAESDGAARPTVRPRIVVTADLDDEGLARLRDLGEVEYASFRKAMRLLTGSTLVGALGGAEVFATEVDIVDAKALAELPDLRVVVACRGDAVNVDLDACTAFGIPVLHAPGRNADAVADLAVAFMLMLARRLPLAAAFLRQPGMTAGDTARMGQAFGTLQGHELWRKTVGLVGLGAVGRGVARRLAGFGARVVAYDPHLEPEQVILAGAEPVAFDELIEQSDFVSLHAPVSDATRGLIGAAELARMKEGAFLINTARAALVDEDALAAALASGRLAGAALDVFSVEPPGSDHPLLAFDNVIATPHVGGNTVEVGAHQGRIIAADLARLLAGERPLHALNPQVLDGFDWTKPRRAPDAKTVARLAERPGPAVTDLQRVASGKQKQVGGEPGGAAAASAPPEMVDRMRGIVREFLDRIAGDEEIRTATADKDVTLHFTLTDLALPFFLHLKGSETGGDLGDPAEADVELKMRADVFDGMFTGRVNAMQAAMSGGLSFSGDTTKAMTLQDLQAEFARLYQEARQKIGDPGDLAALGRAAGTNGGSGKVVSLAPGDVRAELVQVVGELYAQELITATGGNVSARIPGRAEEIWITPSALFKGQLRPEMLVRIDVHGKSLDPDALSPSSEKLMHCAAYRARPEAHAVVHAHAPHATILANAGLPFLPISTEAAFFGEIPRIPFIMPGSQELADAIAAALEHSWAVLMVNHGLLVAGRSLRRAADMVEIIDRSAEVILGCYAVGKPPPTLPEDVIQRLQKMGDLLA